MAALERRLTLAANAASLRQWLWRSHVLEFARPSSAEHDALYHQLCAKLASFSFLPGAQRQDKALFLPLRWRWLRGSLLGEVESEWISAERGERRSHLLARFPLSGGWELKLKLSTRQELVSGRVRLGLEFWFEPGHKLSFRWIILARALRWALSTCFSTLTSQLGARHG